MTVGDHPDLQIRAAHTAWTVRHVGHVSAVKRDEEG